MIQNPFQIISQFNNFRQQFSGDPRAEVQRLMQSGQMSQDQFNYLQAMATQLQQVIRSFK